MGLLLFSLSSPSTPGNIAPLGVAMIDVPQGPTRAISKPTESVQEMKVTLLSPALSFSAALRGTTHQESRVLCCREAADFLISLQTVTSI